MLKRQLRTSPDFFVVLWWRPAPCPAESGLNVVSTKLSPDFAIDFSDCWLALQRARLPQHSIPQSDCIFQEVYGSQAVLSLVERPRSYPTQLTNPALMHVSADIRIHAYVSVYIHIHTCAVICLHLYYAQGLSIKAMTVSPRPYPMSPCVHVVYTCAFEGCFMTYGVYACEYSITGS